jgi:hypothetical protein
MIMLINQCILFLHTLWKMSSWTSNPNEPHHSDHDKASKWYVGLGCHDDDIPQKTITLIETTIFHSFPQKIRGLNSSTNSWRSTDNYYAKRQRFRRQRIYITQNNVRIEYQIPNDYDVVENKKTKNSVVRCNVTQQRTKLVHVFIPLAYVPRKSIEAMHRGYPLRFFGKKELLSAWRSRTKTFSHDDLD